ncbi:MULTISPECIES: hypothetical protein [unclassified Moorena]|nr:MULTISPECIES: hypothetical protein [unclassified Moorena]
MNRVNLSNQQWERLPEHYRKWVHRGNMVLSVAKSRDSDRSSVTHRTCKDTHSKG